MSLKQFIVHAFTLLMLVGCMKADIPPLPGSYLPADVYVSTNGEFILLTVPEQFNTFKIGDSIGILFQNKSEYKFNYKYNDTKLYFLDESNSWFEVNNTALLVGDGETEIGEDGNTEIYSTDLVTFDTDVFYNKSTYLRVVMIFEVPRENRGAFSSNKIAVMVDVKLNP
jgi:hypothetical protein